jgi:hypothetical protein
VSIQGNAIRSLGPAESVDREIVEGLLALFTLRDRRVEEATNDVNNGKRHFVPYRKSFYFGAEVFEELVKDPVEFYRSHTEAIAPHTSRIYFMVEVKSLNRTSWQLIILDFNNQCIYHLDPSKSYGSRIEHITLNVSGEEHNSVHYTSEYIKDTLNTLLRECPDILVARQWCFAVSDLIVEIEINEDDFSNGIYVFAFIYYFSCELPLVMSRNDIQALRRKWIHWLLMGALPI